jgi:prepilin-type N-terminal cleavage/methylation domain-containing protein
MGFRRTLRRIGRRLADRRGHTLIELLVVLSIMGTVMGGLARSFATGMNQEVDQVRREQAYARARVALQRMRVDVHCASGVTGVVRNAYGGYTLTLTENNVGESGWCATVIPSSAPSSGVQWCTITDPDDTSRFKLYRYLGTDVEDCNGGAGSTFEVDYVAIPPGGWPSNSSVTPTPPSWAGNIWPSAENCDYGELPTLAIDLNVALDPAKHARERYELRDAIALRNGRCT